LFELSRAVSDNVPASPSAEPLGVYAPRPDPDQDVEPEAVVVVATYLLGSMRPPGSVNAEKLFADRVPPAATACEVGAGAVTGWTVPPPPDAPPDAPVVGSKHGAIGITLSR
jgi:hypothetical protein